MPFELDTNSHAVFSLNYHLVLVTKYRRKVFTTQRMFDRLREITEYIGKSHNIEIKQMNGEPDHVHFLLRTKPNCDLSKYINAIKSATSRRLKQEFPDVKKKLWKEFFWSQSYCLLTVGGAPLEILKKYIESQAGPSQ
jgi:putative transposase